MTVDNYSPWKCRT